MKKIKTFFAAMAIMMTSLALTSCDEDQSIGMNLEGTWAGNMYVSYQYSGHTYYATRSELEFSCDPFRFTRGEGYWVDYYSRAPWDYYASHIRWEVRNKVIYIDFIEDRYTLEIHDYRLITDSYRGDTFRGYIYGDNGQLLEFNLYRISEPNWSGYDYGWDSWQYGYYAKKMGDGDGTTRAITERPVRHIGQ